MENLSEEEDNRLEDSPQQQSSASSRSPSPASSAHEEEPVAPRTRRDDPAALNSPVSYSLAVQQRQAPYRASPRPPAKGYAIESVYSILCATDINAIALPPCASHLYTGGADGLVRRYAVHPMLNCSGIAANNLTMKQGGVAPPPDAKFPVLVAYWENEEYGSWANTIKDNVTFGTKNIGIADKVSVVHSLAVQSEELWGLSGTANGTINLYTIRHDEGQIRHVLPASTSAAAGHRANAAVSVLTLTADEKSVLSGAWDHSILEWDLNTGIALRQYKAHSGQISTIAFRPLTSSLTAPSASTQDDDMDIFANEAPHPSFPVPTSPSLSASSSTGVAASLVSKPIAANGQSTAATPDDAFDPLFDQGSDVDADGDVDDDPSHAPMTQSSLPVIPPPRNVPIVGKTSNLPELSTDVFLSTSIDGQVMIWDRRIKGEGKGGVRKLENTKNAGWCSSACWSPSGQEIYVGRRSSVVEIYDIRTTTSTPAAFSPVLQTIKMSKLSGAVSCVAALPSGHHLVSASNDNIRIWDLDRIEGGKDYSTGMIGWRIVPGHHGGVVSQMYIDRQCKFLFSASGSRGWEGTSTETVVVHEITSF